MWCVLDYLLEIWQTAVMQFRLLQHITFKYKKVFVALEIPERPSGKFQRKNQSQIFDQMYRWFCGERNQKTTEPQFPIKSIGGFAVSETKKTIEPKFSIKSIVGFAVSETKKPPS